MDSRTSRRLIVMRHATAQPFAASDEDRNLTDRGRVEAAEAARYLRGAGLIPDLALVSPSVRTRQTWTILTGELGEVEAAFERDIYTGGVDLLLELLRMTPSSVRTILVLGHNPAAEYLAHLMDDGTGDETATTQMLMGFPPASLAVLELSVEWSDVGPGCASLRAFQVASRP